MSPDQNTPAEDTPATGATARLNVEGWSPGEDVIEVQRSPDPGAVRGTWRAFVETARGLAAAAEIARASRWNRPLNSSWAVLIATSRPRRVSRALNTAPMPPSPIRLTI